MSLQMVSRKKITSLVLGGVMLIQALPVSAAYYNSREWKSIDPAIFVYESIDIAKSEELAEKGEELVGQNGKSREIFEVLTESGEILSKAGNSVSVAHLAADRDYNDGTRADYSESTENYLTALKYFNRLVKTVSDSRYKSVAGAVLGEDYIEEYIDTMPDEATVELTNREYELLDSYTEAFGDNERTAEIFIELVKVRNEIARKSGYENYARYAAETVYGRECDSAEITQFSENVAKYIAPVYRRLDAAMDKVEMVEVPMTETEVLDSVGKTMYKINNELGECFSYMQSNGLYDIAYDEKKNPGNGTYTIKLPEAEVPFVFLYPEMSYSRNALPSAEKLIHEFGHFAAMLNSSEDDRYIGSNEIAELQSQGLELLAEKYYGKMFGSAAAFERYFLVWGMLAGVVDGCFLNEWETQVYSMDEPTVEKINTVAADLGKKYYDIEYHPDDAEELWIIYPHSFTSPMYYMSYSLSGMTALGLYSLAQTDYDAAVDMYMNISANGAYESFGELPEIYGVGDVFADGTVESIARMVEEMYALAYTDIDTNAWYVPYLYSLSNIADGRERTSFMPDKAITRAEFVGIIGKMYDYYIGIDDTYTQTFADVSADDINGRYIAWANGVGIVSGYDEDSFGGDDPLTREQAAVIIYNLTKAEGVQNTDISFSDRESVSEWARGAVAFMEQNRIIEGRDNGEFDPKANITRAETTKIVSGYIASEY